MRRLQRVRCQMQILFWKVLKKIKEQGVFLNLAIKAQSQKNISDLVEDGHCIVIGDRKWTVKGVIKHKNPED